MAVKGLNHCTMMLEPVMCQKPVNRCTGIAYSLPCNEILEIRELRSSVKVEVDVLGSLSSLMVLMVSVDVKQH